MKRYLNPKHRQQGAALVMALVILLVMTVIGVSALKTSSLEEVLTGNLRDRDLAFQAAETAITDAENKLSARTVIPVPDAMGSSGIFPRNAFGDFRLTAYDTGVWANGTEFGTAAYVDLKDVGADPVFITEEEMFIADDLNPETTAKGLGKYTYRVTSRGTGLSDNAVVMLQTTFARRYK